MDLDGKGLGRLRRVADPREVWSSEAGDFTPWLADNLDVLSEELGLSMTLTGTEVPVGDFRLDIAAETPDGRRVIIENQLERTDHSHLGQLLVYASGLEAAAVVWVATAFRDEFRRSLDWLNERTDTGVDFFGVEVGVVQIGESGPAAPVFDVVARPNGWQKAVKERGAGPGRGRGQANQTRQEFFAEILAEVAAARPNIRVPRPGDGNWINFAAGPFGTWGIVIPSDGRLRIEAYLDSDKEVNKRLFDELVAEADVWQGRLGSVLEWERLDDKKASRIARYHPPFSLDDQQARAEARTWAVRETVAMYDALNETLRCRAREIRDAVRREDPDATAG